MQKHPVLFVITVLVLVVSFTTIGISEDFDFRNTKWGMSSEQVIASEGKQPVDGDSRSLAYGDTLMGKKVAVIYLLVDDKLVRARYSSLERHSNKNFYIDDYEKFKNALTEKYGKPISDERFWRNDLYRDERKSYGLAVSIGHLSYYAKWETETTIVIIALSGNNYKVRCIIEYTGKDFIELEKQYKKKKTESKL
jgi:hypothetical protein